MHSVGRGKVFHLSGLDDDSSCCGAATDTAILNELRDLAFVLLFICR